jgi:5-deoxy-glucuronate isomerase
MEVSVIHKVTSDYAARIHIEGTGDVERRLQVTPEIAGWEYLYFRTYTYRTGMVINGESAAEEMVMVLLSGKVVMEVAGQVWQLEGRSSVFHGLPYTIYLPPGYNYRMTVLSDSDCAYSRAPATGRLQPRMIPPEALNVEMVGEGLFQHQVTHILDPGDAEKLLCVEMHIPAGHWADYPSHRHTCPGKGAVNAIHYYRFQSEAGWGLQRLYLPDGSLDEAVTVRNGDAVIVRQSAHPVVASPETAMYTLNFLACAQPSWEVEVLPPSLIPGNE